MGKRCSLRNLAILLRNLFEFDLYENEPRINADEGIWSRRSSA